MRLQIQEERLTIEDNSIYMLLFFSTKVYDMQILFSVAKQTIKFQNFDPNNL